VTSDVAGRYRQVLGQYPTGVVVVTALDDKGGPLGMTVGSFTSVSLDPPLVAFLPDKGSSSWAALEKSGDRFCINVLGNSQEDICRKIAVRKRDKFVDIPWHVSPQGQPVIDGCVAYIDCVIDQVVDAGDHYIVVCAVTELDVESVTDPLLFFRGGYGSFTPLSLASADMNLVDQLRQVDIARPVMETLAVRFDTEVTAVCLVHGELCLVAAVGLSETAVAPSRVGQRMPFLPPVGSVFAAYGGQELLNTWLLGLDPAAGPEQRAYYEEVAETISSRGYSVALGHENSGSVERAMTRLNVGDPGVTPEGLRAAVRSLAEGYNPTELNIDSRYELHLASAPVFDSAGRVVFTLNLWGPERLLTVGEITARTNALTDAAEEATHALRYAESPFVE
jgi:flavin reductase (DIM6/NTAB) family NADH-FMN oxidoreductase RutF/DNA-binding IclR family transcriptional regulator